MNDAVDAKRMMDPRLKRILLGALLVDDIAADDTIETVDLWDSMRHMELMAALEQEYKVVFEPEEIIRLTSVRAIAKFLEERGLL
ncbi:MAG TPA: acyl carrier protein [Candidatus Omnitrophota bacterium]|nr:acyl carrier protein [Candidatus Omnitrophota bacterium]HRZ15282.1 acyl carrier protein [Candidatus Omnitrophota bacterium]